MSQEIVLFVVVLLFLAVAVWFVRGLLQERGASTAVQNFLNDTGYANTVVVRAKILDQKKLRGYGGFVVPSAVEYPWLLFETETGEQLEFQVEERLYHKVCIGQTGTLCYTEKRLEYFEVDDTTENLAKMFLCVLPCCATINSKCFT